MTRDQFTHLGRLAMLVSSPQGQLSKGQTGYLGPWLKLLFRNKISTLTQKPELFFFFNYFLLKRSCFIMCQFLLYSKVNQLYVYIYLLSFDFLPIYVTTEDRLGPVAQMVKNLPAVKETRVQSLCQEDSLEKGMAIHSSNLAQRIPWAEEPGGLLFTGSQRVGHY